MPTFPIVQGLLGTAMFRNQSHQLPLRKFATKETAGIEALFPHIFPSFYTPPVDTQDSKKSSSFVFFQSYLSNNH